MKTSITKIKTCPGAWGQPRSMALADVVAAIRNPRRLRQTERVAHRLEEARCGAEPDAARQATHTLPYLIFSATFGRQGLNALAHPTGLVLLSLHTGSDLALAQNARLAACQLPQTVAVFGGCSHQTVKVVVHCQPADGPLPTEQTCYAAFLQTAHQQAARYYGAACRCRVLPMGDPLTAGCRMGCDPQAYYNPRTQPLYVVTTAGNALAARHQTARTDAGGQTTSDPDRQQQLQERTRFYNCLRRAREAVGGDQSPLATERMLVRLAQLCHGCGLAEEASVVRAAGYVGRQVGLDDIRKMFRAAYTTQRVGRPWSDMSEKEQVARKVEEFFDRRYELRFNELKLTEEFRPKDGTYGPWQPLTERDMKRMAHEEMKDVGAAWYINIEVYVRSALVRSYNPVHEFLAGCGRWNGRCDYIGELARRVPNSFAQWEPLFHRWFLAMVAGWTGKSRDFSNSVVPMLIGRQGTHKTTFCKQLLPPSLREYYIDDIKLDSSEQVERMLCRMALVNIDEYNAKTSREQAKIKRVLTERDVQTRRMHSEQYVMRQRMASFIATTNEPQPLTDPTGSRRYLCVEVTGSIDTDKRINYQQLYAQALWELEHGRPYYLSREEEETVEAHNQTFVQQAPVQVLLEHYFAPAPRQQEHFMLAVDMLTELQEHTHGPARPNMRQLLQALRAARYEYGALGGKRGWYARRR